MEDGQGHDHALPAGLIESLYAELRAAAQAQMVGERAGHTLSATALVHEAFLKLAGPRDVPWRDKAQFFAAAVEAMRRIRLDHARGRRRDKRGGGRVRVDLEAALRMPLAEQEDSLDFVALDEAVCRLMDKDARAAEVVRLRYYAGLTNAEAAAVLKVSERTVKNDWAFAKAWLGRAMRADGTE